MFKRVQIQACFDPQATRLAAVMGRQRLLFASSPLALRLPALTWVAISLLLKCEKLNLQCPWVRRLTQGECRFNSNGSVPRAQIPAWLGFVFAQAIRSPAFTGRQRSSFASSPPRRTASLLSAAAG